MIYKVGKGQLQPVHFYLAFDICHKRIPGNRGMQLKHDMEAELEEGIDFDSVHMGGITKRLLDRYNKDGTSMPIKLRKLAALSEPRAPNLAPEDQICVTVVSVAFTIGTEVTTRYLHIGPGKDDTLVCTLDLLGSLKSTPERDTEIAVLRSRVTRIASTLIGKQLQSTMA